MGVKGQSTLSTSPNRSSSRSANPSVDTLELTEQLKNDPEAFTNRYLTEKGEGKVPTNTAKKVLGLDTTMAHIAKAKEYAKTSRLFRAMNPFGGTEPNQRIIKRLEQIVRDGSQRKFIPLSEQSQNKEGG
jgi:hypothetical protein